MSRGSYADRLGEEASHAQGERERRIEAARERWQVEAEIELMVAQAVDVLFCGNYLQWNDTVKGWVLVR